MSSAELKRNLKMNFLKTDEKVELVQKVLAKTVQVTMPGLETFLLEWAVSSLSGSAKAAQKKAGKDCAKSDLIPARSLVRNKDMWVLVSTLGASLDHQANVGGDLVHGLIKVLAFLLTALDQVQVPEWVPVLRMVADAVPPASIPLNHYFDLLVGLAQVVATAPAYTPAAAWLEDTLLAAAVKGSGHAVAKRAFHAVVGLIPTLVTTLDVVSPSGAPSLERGITSLFRAILFHPDHLGDFQLAFTNAKSVFTPRDADESSSSAPGGEKKKMFGSSRKRNAVYEGKVKSYHRTLFDTLEEIARGSGSAKTHSMFAWILRDYANAVIMDYGIGRTGASEGRMLDRFKSRVEASSELDLSTTSDSVVLATLATLSGEQRNKARKAQFSFFSELVLILTQSTGSQDLLWTSLHRLIGEALRVNMFSRTALSHKTQTQFMKSLIEYTGDYIAAEGSSDGEAETAGVGMGFQVLSLLLRVSHESIFPILPRVLPLAVWSLTGDVSAPRLEFVKEYLVIQAKLTNVPGFIEAVVSGLKEARELGSLFGCSGWGAVMAAMESTAATILPGPHLWSIWATFQDVLNTAYQAKEAHVFCPIAGLMGAFTRGHRISGPSAARVVDALDELCGTTIGPILSTAASSTPESALMLGSALLLYRNVLALLERARDQTYNPFDSIHLQGLLRYFIPATGLDESVTGPLDLAWVSSVSPSELSPFTSYALAVATVSYTLRLHDAYRLIVNGRDVMVNEMGGDDGGDAAHMAQLVRTLPVDEVRSTLESLAGHVGALFKTAVSRQEHSGTGGPAGRAWDGSELGLLGEGETAGAGAVGVASVVLADLDVISQYMSSEDVAFVAGIMVDAVVEEEHLLHASVSAILDRHAFPEIAPVRVGMSKAVFDYLDSVLSSVSSSGVSKIRSAGRKGESALAAKVADKCCQADKVASLVVEPGQIECLSRLFAMLARWPVEYLTFTRSDNESLEWVGLVLFASYAVAREGHLSQTEETLCCNLGYVLGGSLALQLSDPGAVLTPDALLVNRILSSPIVLGPVIRDALVAGPGGDTSWLVHLRNPGVWDSRTLARVVTALCDGGQSVFRGRPALARGSGLLETVYVPLVTEFLTRPRAGGATGEEPIEVATVRSILNFEQRVCRLGIPHQALERRMVAEFRTALRAVLSEKVGAGMEADGKVGFVHAVLKHVGTHGLNSEEDAGVFLVNFGASPESVEGEGVSCKTTLAGVLIAYVLTLLGGGMNFVPMSAPTGRELEASRDFVLLDAAASVFGRIQRKWDSAGLASVLDAALDSELSLGSRVLDMPVGVLASRVRGAISALVLVRTDAELTSSRVWMDFRKLAPFFKMWRSVVTALEDLTSRVEEGGESGRGEVSAAVVSGLSLATHFVRSGEIQKMPQELLSLVMHVVDAGFRMLPVEISGSGPGSSLAQAGEAYAWGPSETDVACGILTFLSALFRSRASSADRMMGFLGMVTERVIRMIVFTVYATDGSPGVQANVVREFVGMMTVMAAAANKKIYSRKRADTVHMLLSSFVAQYATLAATAPIPVRVRSDVEYGWFQVLDVLSDVERASISAHVGEEERDMVVVRGLVRSYKVKYKFGGQ